MWSATSTEIHVEERKIEERGGEETRHFRLAWISEFRVKPRGDIRSPATCRKNFVKLGRHGARVTDYTVYSLGLSSSSLFTQTRRLCPESLSFSCSTDLRFARLDPDAGPWPLANRHANAHTPCHTLSLDTFVRSESRVVCEIRYRGKWISVENGGSNFWYTVYRKFRRALRSNVLLSIKNWFAREFLSYEREMIDGLYRAIEMIEWVGSYCSAKLQGLKIIVVPGTFTKGIWERLKFVYLNWWHF